MNVYNLEWLEIWCLLMLSILLAQVGSSPKCIYVITSLAKREVWITEVPTVFSY